MNIKKRKKILLVGGEGFIGRNIVDELQGNYDCYSIGIEKSPFFRGKRGDTYISANPYTEKIEGIFDVMIHLVDNAVPIDNFKTQEKRLLDNVSLTENAQIILFSSAVLYANPTSEYAQRKLALESVVSGYTKEKNIKLVIFRLFNIFGKYQMPFKQGSFVANVICNHLMHVPTEILDMNAKRDFMFAGDMAKFVRFVIETEYNGSTDLATQKLSTLSEMIVEIEEKVVYEKLNILDKGMHEDIVCPLAKNILIKNVVLTSMEKRLQEVYNFYKNNIQIINMKK